MELTIELAKEYLVKYDSMRKMEEETGISRHKLSRFCIENNININVIKEEYIKSKKFSKLKVIKLFSKKYKRKIRGKSGYIHNRTYALCECECGKIKEIRYELIKAGRTISCGCWSKNRLNVQGNKNHYFSGSGELSSKIFKHYARGAKVRNIEFTITIEYAADLFEKQGKRCALTGIPLCIGRYRRHHETTASLDRIDSSKGYVEGNVQWVLKDINTMKKATDEEYFKFLCNLVASKHKDIEEDYCI